MHANKQEPEECLHKPYTICHIKYIRHTIYGICYMVYGYGKYMHICIYVRSCHSSFSFAFFRFRFIFIFISNFILFVSHSFSLSLSLSVCGSCGFQQKSIIYVMAKHCRDPQTVDWGDCRLLLLHCLLCATSNIEQFVAIPRLLLFVSFHFFAGYFSLRFCICAVNCTSQK